VKEGTGQTLGSKHHVRPPKIIHHLLSYAYLIPVSKSSSRVWMRSREGKRKLKKYLKLGESLVWLMLYLIIIILKNKIN
jgi:hypothetical protein